MRPSLPPAPRPDRAPRILAALVFTLGLLALLAWVVGAPPLALHPPGHMMPPPQSAIGFQLGGIALYCLATRRLRAARLMALPMAVFPVITLLQHWTGQLLGAGLLFLPASMPERDGLPHPARMSELAAAEFLLFALLLLSPRHGRRLYRVPTRIATTGLLVALIGLAGYHLGAQELARAGAQTTMSLISVLGFALLFTGALLVQRDRHWLRRLLSASPGSRLTRRLLAHVVASVIVLGFAIPLVDPLMANPRLELALYVVTLSVLQVVAALRFARQFDRSEAQRLKTRTVLETTEARLSGVLASTLDAVITVDASQRVVFFNPAAEKVFGCPVNEATGAPLERFIPARFRNAHAGHVLEFGRTGVTSRRMGSLGTLSALRNDGTEFPIEASISQIRIAGEPFFTVILRDVTERKRAEARLLESETYLRQLISTLPGMVWTCTRDGAVEYVSQQWLDYTGTTLASQLGSGAFEPIHPDDRAMVQRAWAEALRQETAFDVEFRLRRHDRVYRWVNSRGIPVRDQESAIVRWAGIVTDIDDLKRAQVAILELNTELERRVAERTAALTHANEALLKSNEDLQRFAYIASHDLQTPLRTIAGFSQILLHDYRGRLDGHADELLNRIVDATRRMHALIRDVLAYSRVDSEARPFERIEVDEILRNALAMLAGLIEETGAEITHGGLPVVEGDRGQLTRLLQNLIENGIKYRGDAPPRIHIGAELVQNEWIFSVRDNGVGIEPRHRDAIFEIFRRLHSSQTHPGTGIGLSVCRRVVERHGGRIWVTSEPGHGSVFHFTLPCAREPSVHEQATAAAPPGRSPAGR